MITKMSKIHIIGLKSDAQKLLSVLHRLGVLHIEYEPLPDILRQRGIDRVLLAKEEEEEQRTIEETIKKVDDLLPQIEIPYSEEGIREFYQELAEASFADVQTRADDLYGRIKSIIEERSRLQGESFILTQYRNIIGSFLETVYDLSRYEDMECLALVFPKKFEKEIGAFQELIEAKTESKINLHLADLDEKKVVALLFYEKRFSSGINEEIFGQGAQKIVLPQEYLSKSFEENISLIEERQKAVEEGLAKCDEDFPAKEELYLLHAAKLVFQDRLDALVAKQDFVESEYTVSLTGWLPKKKQKEVENTIEKKLEGRVIVNDITKSAKNRDEIPVLLHNPQSVKPFEQILSLLQMPKYGSLDPSTLFAVFFPIFFGMIVGDAGYGLVLLIISFILRRKKKPMMKVISKIVFYVSVWTIIFGVVYVEFFGELGSKITGIEPWFHRGGEHLIHFLILAISVGACHVLLGLVLGIIEAIKEKHRKEMLEKIAIILSLFGLFFLVASLTPILPSNFWVPSTVLLIISFPILVYTKGFMGPLETISTVANILSYARIMALGVAGVMMAHVANTLGAMGNIVLGIVVASLLHILNIALSMFSPTVQSFRLHYVEFFKFFYQPGGKRYAPFKRRGDL